MPRMDDSSLIPFIVRVLAVVLIYYFVATLFKAVRGAWRASKKLSVETVARTAGKVASKTGETVDRAARAFKEGKNS